jgi:DNA-binding MarR family transcriptional regulator
MNQDIHLSSEKLIALDRLVAAIRIFQTASDRMDEAFVALLGVNRTDGRCLDIVQRLGQITAGELAHHSGLTTGAVTAVIDRLEAAGYLRRVRDTVDRRKVFVELTALARDLAEIVYAEIGVLSGDGMGRMEAAEMDVIARFLRTSARMNEILSSLLLDYVDGKARDPVERLRAARNFSARVLRERDALAAEMRQSWLETPPDIPSGKFGYPGYPGYRPAGKT